MNFDNKTIGVFFGGKSPEHEISIITGEFVLANLKKMGYKTVAVYIAQDGTWHSNDEIAELKFFKDDFQQKLSASSQYSLNLAESKDVLVLEQKSLLKNEKIIIDYVFPAFHGMGGEDGTIQGLLELFGVPYAGCGVYASAVAIDKGATKQLFTSLNFNTTNYKVYHKNDWTKTRQDIMAQISTEFQLPIFVKPTRAGSSIGISKVKAENNLEEALDLAFYYDTKIIVEDSVENIMDLTCAVLSDGESVVASEVQESIFESDLFDFEVKYLQDGGAQTGNATSQLAIPARIPDELALRIKEQSKAIFHALDANGTLRVDFLFNKETEELYVNEINTLPGTLYHHLWKESNVEIESIIERMLQHGMRRWEEEQNKNYDYHTDVLNSANQMKLQYDGK